MEIHLGEGHLFDRNELHGTVDWGALPRALEKLSLSYNQFEGGVVFSELPRTLRELDVEANRFSGEVDFEAIPEDMFACVLSHNWKLRGTLDYSKLRKRVIFMVSSTEIEVKERMMQFRF